jgi:hypothetical protein
MSEMWEENFCLVWGFHTGDYEDGTSWVVTACNCEITRRSRETSPPSSGWKNRPRKEQQDAGDKQSEPRHMSSFLRTIWSYSPEEYGLVRVVRRKFDVSGKYIQGHGLSQAKNQHEARLRAWTILSEESVLLRTVRRYVPENVLFGMCCLHRVPCTSFPIC